MKKKKTSKKLSKEFIPSIIPKKTIVLLLLICFQVTYSQKFHIPDSLKNKSYKELSSGFQLNLNDTLKQFIYAKTYLRKANNENDTIRIAKAYTLFAWLSKIYDDAIKYSDSIIYLTKNLNHQTYPGFGYMTKGMSLHNKGDYETALENYIIAYNYAEKNNNLEQILFINSSIAELKIQFGNHTEALKIYKSIFNTLKSNGSTNIQNFEHLYFKTLMNLSNSYILNKNSDSAQIYCNKGISKSLSLNDSVTYYNFVSQSGIIAYYQNNFKMAIDSLEKALPYEYSENGILNNHYYRGKIYNVQNNDLKAFYHFNKADSIYNITQDVVTEVRDIQEYFVNYYKKSNDTKNQLKYIDRLLKIDSIIDKTRENLNETIHKKYDTPALLSEKEHIINNLEKEKSKSRFIIYSLFGFVVIATGAIISLNKRQRKTKERFNNLLEGIEQQNFFPEKPMKSSSVLHGVPEAITDMVLLELKKFETNNSFLDNKITLNSLSKQLNTNSNYLSKIINFYKKKNFSTYLSDLRITYCVKNLKENETFRKYSIKAIAYEIGFNNTESFSKAFYKKTGIHPSYFIKELEKQS